MVSGSISSERLFDISTFYSCHLAFCTFRFQWSDIARHFNGNALYQSQIGSGMGLASPVIASGQCASLHPGHDQCVSLHHGQCHFWCLGLSQETGTEQKNMRLCLFCTTHKYKLIHKYIIQHTNKLSWAMNHWLNWTRLIEESEADCIESFLHCICFFMLHQIAQSSENWLGVALYFSEIGCTVTWPSSVAAAAMVRTNGGVFFLFG